MPNYKGLKSIYDLFKSALNLDQDFLDPDNAKAKYPKVMGIFQYTLKFKYFYMRGDTDKESMENFCSLYNKKIASGKELSDMFDPDILVFDGKSLLLAGDTKSTGLRFILK